MTITQLTTNGENTANAGGILHATKTTLSVTLLKAFIEVAVNRKSGETVTPGRGIFTLNYAVSSVSVNAPSTEALAKTFAGRTNSKTFDLCNLGDTVGRICEVLPAGTYLYVWVDFPAVPLVYQTNIWLSQIEVT